MRRVFVVRCFALFMALWMIAAQSGVSMAYAEYAPEPHRLALNRNSLSGEEPSPPAVDPETPINPPAVEGDEPEGDWDDDWDDDDWVDDSPMGVAEVYLADAIKLALLELGEDISALSLPDKAYVSFRLEDGWHSFNSSIDWDLDAVDISTPGWAWIEGTTTLPQDYEFLKGDLTVRHRLLIYDPELQDVATLVSGHVIANGSNIVPRGTDDAAREAFYRSYRIDSAGEEALSALMGRYANAVGEYYLQDDMGDAYHFYYPVSYDISLADMNTVGHYSIFSLPPSYFKYGPAALQDVSIHVLDPLEVDLSAWTVSGTSQISFEWFREISAPELWVSVDGGEWRHADMLMDEGYNVYEGWTPYDFAQDWRTGKFDGLQIVDTGLITGHTYEFEVRYEDGGISVNSFLLDLREGRFARYGNGGGSRGGSDREEIDPPPTKPGDGGGATAPVDEEPDFDPPDEERYNDPVGIDPVVPEEQTTAPAEPAEEMADSTTPWEETTAPAESAEKIIDSATPREETTAPAEPAEIIIDSTTPREAPRFAGTQNSPPASMLAREENGAAAALEYQAPADHLPVTPDRTESDSLQHVPQQDAPQAESSIPALPAAAPVTVGMEAFSSPAGSLIPIAVVGVVSALGAALLWKLLAKRWVKRR